MSKVHRKEFQETKVTRTVSPGRRVYGSSQNVSQFNNNLDNLLEDLQSSVSRPGSRLNNYESNRSNSLNRVTHLKASNPVTEYSSDDSYAYASPDGTKSVKGYKKETYSSSYSNGIQPERARMQSSINQLDSLLDDLKQVRNGGSINMNAGIDDGLIETETSKVVVGKKRVERELLYGDTPVKSSSFDRSQKEGSVSREIHTYGEGTYGETRPIRHTTPSPSQSRTSTLTRQKKVSNVHSYPMEVMETTTPDINPEILANLDPDLMPTGNTKVTTTIKTYTYEIPGSGSPLDNEKYVYSPNQSMTTPSKSFVYNDYNKNVYNETTTNIQPYQKPQPPLGSSSNIIKETVTRNYQPGYQSHVDGVPSNQTYLYNESTTTNTYNQNGYPSPPNDDYQRTRETFMHKEEQTKKHAPYRTPSPISKTVMYKESHTTNNNYIPPEPPTKTPIYNRSASGSSTPSSPQLPRKARPGEPPQDVNITYKYTSHSNRNNYSAGYPYPSKPEENQPLLRPQPFPRDVEDIGPPKQVEELMAKIGEAPPDSALNAGFSAHEAEVINQRKVDSLNRQKSEDLQKKEYVPSSKNITGPPVYYPPGHEMFSRKEESGGWRAEGAMAKESGKYKYEAESKEKSKSRSGAAVVPVCLPLCCGLPCVIL